MPNSHNSHACNAPYEENQSAQKQMHEKGMGVQKCSNTRSLK